MSALSRQSAQLTQDLDAINTAMNAAYNTLEASDAGTQDKVRLACCLST